MNEKSGAASGRTADLHRLWQLMLGQCLGMVTVKPASEIEAEESTVIEAEGLAVHCLIVPVHGPGSFLPKFTYPS